MNSKQSVTMAAALMTAIFCSGAPLGFKKIARDVRAGDRRSHKEEALAKAEAKRKRKAEKLRALAAKGAIAS